MTSIALGTRCMLHGYKATIKYIGEVRGTHGVWLGVEWDDPSRGKHNGEKDGISYFTCLVPGSGSFIRPSSSIAFGCSFLQALSAKYVDIPHEQSQKELVILGSSNGAIEVEAVGLDKIRGKLAKLENLKEVSLDGEEFATADPPGSIARVCPNIRGLNLSNTLLSSWSSLACIARELPKLERLDLSCNRFMALQDMDTNVSPSAFSSLQELRLNQTLIRWPDVIALVSAMPNLRYVELGYNRLQRLRENTDAANSAIKHPDVSHPHVTSLETVNLDGNELEEWNDVMTAMSIFSWLKRLVLTSNLIRRIPHPTNDPAKSLLQEVRHIGLQDNFISNWCDIDALDMWFPTLQSLHMSGTPSAEEISEFRQLTIARLPCLTVLNGSPISAKERTDCELYYLSSIVRNTDLRTDDERSQAHPRWRELCGKHGQAEETPSSSSSPNKAEDMASQHTLGDKLISKQTKYTAVERALCSLRLGALQCVDVHWYGSTQPHGSTNSSQSESKATGDFVRGSSSKFDIASAPSPISMRVLPSMSMRSFRLKLMKALKAAQSSARTSTSVIGGKGGGSGSGVAELSVCLVMGDGTLSELDFEDNRRDLAWWGFQPNSRIAVYSK